MKLIKEYQDKVDQLIEKLIKAQEFANKLPIFKDYIIKNEIIESNWNKLGDRYKSIYLSWGINRGRYSSDSGRTVTNMKGEYDEILTNVYINSLNLYNRYDKYGLDILKELVFFYDELNTTFYIKDEQLESFFEALNEWYLDAREEAKKDFDREKIEKLQKELERLQND